MMEIQDKTHPLYLGRDRFNELLEKDPKRLGEIFDIRSEIARQEREVQFKALGIPFSYSDPDYPDCLIEEQPDGRRFIIELDPEQHYTKRIVREIPPKAR